MSLQLNNTTKSPILYMAMELSASKWKLCFGISNGTRKRLRNIDAGNMKALESEIISDKELYSRRGDSRTDKTACRV